MMKLKWSLFLNLETYFVLLSLIAGLFFAFIIPPNQVPDEGTHFARVYAILNGDFNHSPTQLTQGLNELLANGYNATSGRKISIDSYIHEFTLQDDRTHTVNSYPSNYSPIVYLPQIIGVAVGKTLHISDLSLFILGRLVSLAVYICIGCWVLKTTPFAKGTLFVLLTLPMSIFVAASYSADAMQIGLTLIYLNYLMLGINSSSPLSIREWTIFFALSILLSLTKPMSLLIPFASLAIPISRFGNFKKKLIFVIGQIGVGVIVAVMWGARVASILINPSLPYSVQPFAQLAFIALNPIAFANILIHTLFVKGGFYFQSLIGYFGWLSFTLPDFASFLFLIAFFIALFSEPKSVFPLSKEQKALFILVFGLYALGFTAIMYLLWSPVGNDTVEGVQGRYFIPVIPLLIYVVVGSLKETIPFKRVWPISIAVLTTFVLAVSMQTIYLKYYVTCGEYFYNVKEFCKLPVELQANQVIGEITAPVTQTFTSECDKISGVELLFATYARQNNGSLNITLMDQTSNIVIFKQKVRDRDLQDNAWASFHFASVKNAQGKSFAITITPKDVSPGNAVTLWATGNDMYPQGELIGGKGGGDILFHYICQYGILDEIRSLRK